MTDRRRSSFFRPAAASKYDSTRSSKMHKDTDMYPLHFVERHFDAEGCVPSGSLAPACCQTSSTRWAVALSRPCFLKFSTSLSCKALCVQSAIEQDLTMHFIGGCKAFACRSTTPSSRCPYHWSELYFRLALPADPCVLLALTVEQA